MKPENISLKNKTLLAHRGREQKGRKPIPNSPHPVNQWWPGKVAKLPNSHHTFIFLNIRLNLCLPNINDLTF